MEELEKKKEDLTPITQDLQFKLDELEKEQQVLTDKNNHHERN